MMNKLSLNVIVRATIGVLKESSQLYTIFTTAGAC